MNDSSAKNFWAAVSAIAAVAGVLVTILIWRSQGPADGSGAEQSASPEADGGGDGTWQESDAYTVRLPATFQGDDCWDRHVDLDEQGESDAFHGDSAPAEWADLIWYSCGTWQTGYLYSPISASGTAALGEDLEPGGCASATSGETSFGMEVDPDAPPTGHGCLITTSGALAGVSLTALEWVGEAAEAELTVVLWNRRE
ncbi:hypothetical protein O1R50_00405 [Glycomyces luteolus]|uniref:Uncharacterized protein n=1 Tax=Glycomyces luteolus TaxID=2670330 RepID=A0A9X3P746_9ACTN|nr:hypothetical protein [Glycomyces luteolus]MDA1358065.1 hypothetical protein [Glycomyces luteolus]